MRIAALIAASFLLFACMPASASESTDAPKAAPAIRVSFHFRDARTRLIPVFGGHMPEKGWLDADASAIASHLKELLVKQGFTLADSDEDADAVVHFRLINFTCDMKTSHFVRKVTIGLELATSAAMGDKTYSQKNSFRTEQKGIDWPLWDTSETERRHALRALMQKFDTASALNAFLIAGRN